MAVPSACVKLEIDPSMYPCFVPVVGVYIAGSSGICLLAMFCDILYALCGKKVWIPCNFFSLNSLTLTLLAIAAKLPVDLTSPMPSALDQVSKLSGNAFVCISMGFFAPSLGKKPKHDCLTNMLALSIFVVTLIINTCLQIRTGVIFLFIPQHVITMCCMLAMLCPLWINFMVVNNQDVPSMEDCRDLIKKSSMEYCMLERIKKAYLISVATETEEMVYALSRNTENCTILGLCLTCAVSLMQPAIQNFSLEFCGGTSDYGKSVWVIVLVQICAVLTGSFATAMRASGMFTRVNISSRRLPRMKKANLSKYNPAAWCLILLASGVTCVSLSTRALVCIPIGILSRGCSLFISRKQENIVNGLNSYTEMMEWMKLCPLDELYEPAANYAVWHIRVFMDEGLANYDKLSKILRTETVYEEMVSDLGVSNASSVKKLIEISSALLPHELFRDLLETYQEVRENFYLISFLGESQHVYVTAESLDLYPREPGRHSLSISAMRADIRYRDAEVIGIIDYIDNKYISVMENDDSEKLILANLITNMFSVMVRSIIREFPNHIYTSLVKENATRDRFCLRLAVSLRILTGIIASVEDYIDWAFPQNSRITRLVTTYPHAIEDMDNDVIVEIQQ